MNPRTVVITQDSVEVCQVWKGDVDLFKNKLGVVIPRRTGKLIGRVTKKFCRRLFGGVPRPKTAVRLEVTNLGKVEIEKQEEKVKYSKGKTC